MRPFPLARAGRAVAAREVAALAHELRDDTVEGGALEVERLAALAHALLARAQRAEVLPCRGGEALSLGMQSGSGAQREEQFMCQGGDFTRGNGSPSSCTGHPLLPTRLTHGPNLLGRAPPRRGLLRARQRRALS